MHYLMLASHKIILKYTHVSGCNETKCKKVSQFHFCKALCDSALQKYSILWNLKFV